MSALVTNSTDVFPSDKDVPRQQPGREMAAGMGGQMPWDGFSPTRSRGLGDNRFSGLKFDQAVPGFTDRNIPDINITSLAALANELDALGWPPPTEITPTSFKWAAGQTSISLEFGPDLERADEGEDGVPRFRQTGKYGILVTGEYFIREKLADIVMAFALALERRPDELVKLFGLKHLHNFPGSPLVPIDFNPTANDYGEMLRAIGQL